MSHTGFASPSVCVAIPARDEAAHITACLEALASQSGAAIDHVVLLVNNSSDGTAEIARRVTMPAGTRLHVLERALPPAQANAGYARRLAMQAAARLSRPDGVLLTTDADAMVDPNWVAANLAALRAGADAVAGWVELDPADWSRIPLRLHEDDARECAYDALCDEIHALLDPDPADPLPRHTQHSGASIAVTLRAYHLAGGIPPAPSGEDRAFIAALRRIDARVRHATECRVVVSGRTEGRAAGGMADTIRRRMVAPDPHLDDRLEPAADCALRASARHRLRACLGAGSMIAGLAADLGLPAAWVAGVLARNPFGVAWLRIESRSPALRRQLVAVADLPREMAHAAAIVTALRQEVRAAGSVSVSAAAES